MSPMEKLLVWVGICLVMMGVFLVGLGLAMGMLGLKGGRLLPGDIVISRPGFTFLLPIATSLVLSMLLTLVVWMMAARRR